MGNKLKTIPLCQLKRSKANIRKTEPLTDIEQLAASILACGLLENLVVRGIPKEADNKPAYEVVAGGRRLAALKLLAKRRKIKRDYRVACLVVDDSAGLEVSLAENFERVPVHPADQCEAFAALVGQGLSADAIAARFGITARFVEQRLKLASVSPRLLMEFRVGAMTLEQLTAFTLTNDHKAQEEVWFESGYHEMPAETIRRFLTSTQVQGHDRRARFVGVQAYEEAGGTVLRDLFDAEDEGYFSDSVLLDRLVLEKLQSLAAGLGVEGWHWIEKHIDDEALRFGRYSQAPRVDLPLADADEKHLLSLGVRYDELVAALEEEEQEELVTELDRIEAEIATLQDKKRGWSDEEKARSGAVVFLDPEGQPQIVRGLVKPNGEAKEAERTTKQRNPRANGYADSVIRELGTQHTAALRELVAQRPEAALTALLHALVDGLFFNGRSVSCLGITVTDAQLDRRSAAIADSKAGQAFAARHAAWVKRLPEPELCWQWLVELDVLDRMTLLAHCVALTINAREGLGSEADARLADATGLDMRMWWKPTRANFLDRLTKNDILETVSEAVSQQASWRLAGLKKERMAKEAEKLLADSGWLPGPLRTAEPSGEAVAAR